jgi:hypothetical protein
VRYKLSPLQYQNRTNTAPVRQFQRIHFKSTNNNIFAAVPIAGNKLAQKYHQQQAVLFATCLKILLQLNNQA